MYVYLKSKGDELWTVGFYDPAGTWHAERDCTSTDEASARVNYLNGGKPPPDRGPFNPYAN